MIDRYTIKFGPAVSQKELEKLLHENTAPATIQQVHKIKAQIEISGDPQDLKEVLGLLKHLAERDEQDVSTR